MPRPVEAARPHKVNGFWFLVRRVPAEFAAYDTRKLVRQSTGIRIVDDPRAVRAGEVVAKLHAELREKAPDLEGSCPRCHPSRGSSGSW
jgi:hypothetical protein